LGDSGVEDSGAVVKEGREWEVHSQREGKKVWKNKERDDATDIKALLRRKKIVKGGRQFSLGSEGGKEEWLGVLIRQGWERT